MSTNRIYVPYEKISPPSPFSTSPVSMSNPTDDDSNVINWDFRDEFDASRDDLLLFHYTKNEAKNEEKMDLKSFSKALSCMPFMKNHIMPNDLEPAEFTLRISSLILKRLETSTIHAFKKKILSPEKEIVNIVLDKGPKGPKKKQLDKQKAHSKLSNEFTRIQTVLENKEADPFDFDPENEPSSSVSAVGPTQDEKKKECSTSKKAVQCRKSDPFLFNWKHFYENNTRDQWLINHYLARKDVHLEELSYDLAAQPFMLDTFRGKKISEQGRQRLKQMILVRYQRVIIPNLKKEEVREKEMIYFDGKPRPSSQDTDLGMNENEEVDDSVPPEIDFKLADSVSSEDVQSKKNAPAQSSYWQECLKSALTIAEQKAGVTNTEEPISESKHGETLSNEMDPQNFVHVEFIRTQVASRIMEEEKKLAVERADKRIAKQNKEVDKYMAIYASGQKIISERIDVQKKFDSESNKIETKKRKFEEESAEFESKKKDFGAYLKTARESLENLKKELAIQSRKLQ